MKPLKILTEAVSACLCIIIIFGAALPAVAAPSPAVCSHRFCTAEPVTIGWEDLPVPVSEGGVFTDINGDAVSFGGYPADGEMRLHSTLHDESVYPVSKTAFLYGELECTLIQFADKTSAGETDVIAVYSSLTAKNLSEKSVPMCPTEGLLIPLGDAPDSVDRLAEVRCDYVTPVFCNGTLPDAEKLAAADFDSARDHMEAFWEDRITSLNCFGKDSDEYRGHCVNIINDAICGTVSLMAVYDGRTDKITKDMTPFAVWLLYRRGALGGSPADVYDVYEKAEAICSGITKYDCDYADDVYLYAREGGTPTPESCFGALSDLASCLELMPVFGISDTAAFEDSYKKLTVGTETVFLHTAGMPDGAWELRSLAEDDSLILPLNKETTPAAVCSWYVRGSAMGRLDSGRLSYLAREALRLLPVVGFSDIADCALAAIQPTADGVCIGRGISAGDVRRGVSAEGFGTGGERVRAEILSNDNVVTINIDAPDNMRATVAIPFFRGNIDSADCAFNADSGVLTPDIGCKSITVTLKSSADELCEKYAAKAELESALAEAEAKSTEGCTDISKREFEAALSGARSARNAGVPAEQLQSAADELRLCSARLSKIVSGYTYSVGDGEPVGYISEEVMQNFTLPKSGTVEAVTVTGTYGEGTVLQIYAASDKGFGAKGKCLAEAYSDSAMRFDIHFEAEAGSNYVMVLTPKGGASAAVVCSDSMGLYCLSDKTTVFDGAALDFDMTVSQADRTELDAFYETCQSADVSRYTRESVKNLNTAMHTAAELLRTPDAEVNECEEALRELKLAFTSLTTYASDMKVTATPPALYILIGVTIVLLLGALATASAAGHKRRHKSSDK